MKGLSLTHTHTHGFLDCLPLIKWPLVLFFCHWATESPRFLPLCDVLTFAFLSSCHFRRFLDPW